MKYLREAVVKIIEYFNAENCNSREPVIAPFRSSRERLKCSLSEEFSDKFRKESFREWDETGGGLGRSYSSEELARPRTESFISVVEAELLCDLETHGDLNFRVPKNGSIEDPRDLVGRCLQALTNMGYREIDESDE